MLKTISYLKFLSKGFLLVILIFQSVSAFSVQDTVVNKRICNIINIKNRPPVIDGSLNEPFWNNLEWNGDFVQYKPYSGKEPTLQTRFTIARDNNYIYLAVVCDDPAPDSVDQRMSRRDDLEGELIVLSFDSYHDQRTSFDFRFNAAGAKGDRIISNDGKDRDETWNPIWWVKTSVGRDSWVAEIKIPFSQLRFDNSSDGIWGFNIYRRVFRYNEGSYWQHIPVDASGYVHLYGELHGMNEVKPRKQAEIVPYTTIGRKSYKADTENPFKPGYENILNTGFNAKLGLTNYLTLDLSINPDFGQVEADPSEVNLSAYESFFREKRPLFIEGKNIYDFPIKWGYDTKNLFYSRRIGRRPHYSPELESGEYSKIPQQTNILAAAKISGKTKNGTSIGILETVTGNEFAEIDNAGNRRKEQVEPMTNYFVTRVLQDLNDGNTIIGGILTSTYRDINVQQLEFLPSSAITSGIDLQQYWANKAYYLKFINYGSYVSGTSESILRLQRSPSHLYQRPDADWITLDSAKTSLSGYGGNFRVGKSGGRFNFMAAALWKSPGVDLNDIGYFRMGDEIRQSLWFRYNFYEPFFIFRTLNIEADQYREWDFGGNLATGGYGSVLKAYLKNFWYIRLSGNINGQVRYNSMLRGGPAILIPGSIKFYSYMNTDKRRKFYIEPSYQIIKGTSGHRTYTKMNIELNYRPSNVINFSVEPELKQNSEKLQYVKKIEQNNINRYVFSSIDQTTFDISLRAEVIFNPELTVQYWGQPFIASGNYHDFKYISNGLANDFNDRFYLYQENEVEFNEHGNYFTINEGNSQVEPYNIDNPDFNLKEFQSNLVVRWEYKPGSFIYLVWSQSRDQRLIDPEFSLGNDIPGLLNLSPTNIFLAKISYRIGV